MLSVVTMYQMPYKTPSPTQPQPTIQFLPELTLSINLLGWWVSHIFSLKIVWVIGQAKKCLHILPSPYTKFWISL
jgi:hypothetical protein